MDAPSRTPPGVRELKRLDNMLKQDDFGRTPPGVRELKLMTPKRSRPGTRRTPPGVRELKQECKHRYESLRNVAPLPGCVN